MDRFLILVAVGAVTAATVSPDPVNALTLTAAPAATSGVTHLFPLTASGAVNGVGEGVTLTPTGFALRPVLVGSTLLSAGGTLGLFSNVPVSYAELVGDQLSVFGGLLLPAGSWVATLNNGFCAVGLGCAATPGGPLFTVPNPGGAVTLTPSGSVTPTNPGNGGGGTPPPVTTPESRNLLGLLGLGALGLGSALTRRKAA